MDLFLPNGPVGQILEASKVVGSLCVRCWYITNVKQLVFWFFLLPSTVQGNGNCSWTVDASFICPTTPLPNNQATRVSGMTKSSWTPWSQIVAKFDFCTTIAVKKSLLFREQCLIQEEEKHYYSM